MTEVTLMALSAGAGLYLSADICFPPGIQYFMLSPWYSIFYAFPLVFGILAAHK